MDKKTLELYAMIGSREPIIKWLKEEGVTTKKGAIERLKPIKGGIALSTFLSGAKSSRTFDSSASFLDRIINEFEE